MYSDNDAGATPKDTVMVKVDKIVLDREIQRLGASFDNTVSAAVRLQGRQFYEVLFVWNAG